MKNLLESLPVANFLTSAAEFFKIIIQFNNKLTQLYIHQISNIEIFKG